MARYAEEVLKTLLDQLRTIAKTETVIGEQFTVADFTIIPVSQISLGFGAGGGAGKEGQAGEGGGGGGGARIQPIAFLVVKDGEISLLSISRGKGLSAALEKMPDLMEKGSEIFMKQFGKKESQAGDKAKKG
jgi:uncharacterized spore protein YtfJ